MTGCELKHALKYYNRMIVWVKINEERIMAIAQFSNDNSLSELKKELIISNDYYYNMLVACDDFIKWLTPPINEMVKDKYIREIADVELELDYNYSSRHLLRIIEKNIDEYLKQKKMSEAT